MKIILFISAAHRTEMVLSADSAMLTGRKPYFLPDDMGEIQIHDCRILRVSRLGKHIAPKFADRYYDAVAYGAHFAAEDLLEQARREGRSWTEAIAYDMSLAIGEWDTREEAKHPDGLILTPEEAIAQASRCMTIRQGDLIVLYEAGDSQKAEEGMIIEREGLECRIK